LIDHVFFELQNIFWEIPELKMSKKILFSSINMDDWVVVDNEDEETTLLHCWENLPFDVPFEEFQAHMQEIKSSQERYTLLSLTKAVVMKLYLLWSIMGYTSTAFILLTDSKYKIVIIELIKWFLRA